MKSFRFTILTVLFFVCMTRCISKTQGLCLQKEEKNYEEELRYRYSGRTNIEPLSITTTCSNVTLKNAPLTLESYYKCSHCRQFLNITRSVITVLPSSSFVNFQGINILNMQQLEIKNILPGAFNSLTVLEQLNLSKNNLTQISDGIFNSLWKLKKLDLSENYIQNVTVHCLTGVNYLEQLNLSRNSINTFNNDFFIPLKQIKILDLSYNKLSSFNFTQISYKVEELYLSNNDITEIFGCFTELRNLELSNNRLESLGNFSCSTTFSNLVSLDLSYNRLMRLYGEGFQSLNKLQYLYLQNNKISSISNSCFSNLNSLGFLNLSTNQLEQFQYGLFDHLDVLRTLDVSENKLDALRRYNYHSLKNLINLYIQNNEISYLNSEQLREHLPNLNRTSLDGNKFTCDDLIEIIHNLKHVLHGHSFNSSNVQGIACNQSEFESEVNSVVDTIKPKNFSQLSNDDFTKSAMYNYFNKGFISSNFFKYLENLKNTGDLGNGEMYNYFNKDFKNSSFFKYLEKLKEEKTSTEKLNKDIYTYFNKDFKDSNFIKYLDNLKKQEELINNNFENSKMYNYFNREFENSKFYKYLEALQKPQFLIKYSGNESTPKVEKLVSTFDAENINYSGILVTITILLIINTTILALAIYFMYNVVKIRGLKMTEQVELIEP